MFGVHCITLYSIIIELMIRGIEHYAMHVQVSTSLYSLPLYHNAPPILEVTELGPMDEPHEVPVLPPMHTEVEPTDRHFYTVHDVARMEPSHGRPGSMSVDVEIASTAAHSDTGSVAEPRFSGNGSARGTNGVFDVSNGAAPGSSRGPMDDSEHPGDTSADRRDHVAERRDDRQPLRHLAYVMAELQGALGAAAASGDGMDEDLQQSIRELKTRNLSLLDELSMRKIVTIELEEQQGPLRLCTVYSGKSLN